MTITGTEDARRSLNKMVFMVFTPSLMFASLAKTVTLEDIISWWFMPVNIGFTFLIGGILGWILVKILRPKPHLEGLVIATCSSGNLGNLLLIIIPAICTEDGSPFGDSSICTSVGLSYASFSMALGDAIQETHLLIGQDLENVAASTKSAEDTESQFQIVSRESEHEHGKGSVSFWTKLIGSLHQILEELLAPPTLAAILGFIFGATAFLRNLIIGSDAPLRVIQDSIKLLGDGTIPCITLILGGNLTEGTMTQLFNVGQEECSVLFLWTYLVAALALTAWSTIFMWILS
ncbi:hypothetical protein OIU84_006222 [Salix udensis]|uniref:PIN-like protein n=1 Tax=Salix udensis TaxID=889485 RepID=A0AAD6P2A2_9ROSI|nr:hypothetical protein OIU84_006222 [Salix udensis]